jgi:hypothetical protein
VHIILQHKVIVFFFLTEVPMGRPTAEVDITRLLDLVSSGTPQKPMAAELGISIPTLSKKIAEIQEKQGILLQYKALQALQLTAIQAQVLEAITPEKIDSAPLRDLVYAFKILKDKEQDIDGTSDNVKGLLAHLIALEKQELAAKTAVELTNTQDAEYEEASGKIPELDS